MKKQLLIALSMLLCISTFSQSQLQVFQDWSTTAGTQNFFHKNTTKTDASGSVYSCGTTVNSAGNYDILLQKLNSSGVQQWIVQYDGADNFHDMAVGLFIDGSGNVYITGNVVNDTTTHLSDIITIKYNSSGVQQWIANYNGSGSAYDSGADVTVDGAGNVYITGSGYNTVPNTDAFAIKYNRYGTQQWVKVFNHTTNLNDAGVKVVINGTNIVVTGIVQTTSTNYRPGTMTYDTATGTQVGGALVGTYSTTADQINDMVKDASGNLYLVGGVPVSGQGYNISTIKLSSTMALLWQSTYNGSSNLDDIGNGIQVDGSGNVYITGYTTSSTEGKNFATIKYNSSGTQQWISTYNDALNGNDESKAIVLDASANIYVTGYDSTAINKTDYYTIKYNSSGTEQWNIRADGDAHQNDKATNIALDLSGNIIVAGESQKANGSFEYKTIKYVEKNIITPTDYSGEAPLNNFLFYENKGQVLNSSDSLATSVKYYTENTYPDYYFGSNTMSFVYAKIDTLPSTTDTMHRIDMSFTQSNSSANTYSMEEQNVFANYYASHIPQGITKVHGNQRLVTPGVWSDVDLIYYSNDEGLKYYFVIKPGGTPSNVKLEFTGASSFNLDGTTNVLTINSSLGSLVFDRPIVYQVNSSNVVVPITGWTADWQTNGASNKYKFNLGAYDSTKALIIEVHTLIPSVGAAIGAPVWGTYFGGTKDDIANDITSDNAGNIYVVGTTGSVHTGTNPFPVAEGFYTAIQGNNKGYTDAFIAKFNDNYSPQWITYWGGGDFDEGYGIAHTDVGGGKVYICGHTMGDATTWPLMSAGSGSYQSLTAGIDQGFISRFSDLEGTKEWHTFWAFQNSSCKKIKCDAAGNVYVVGNSGNMSSNTSCTVSSGAMNVCNPGGGAYIQNWHGGGSLLYDGFIAQFNSATQLTWSTYYGGEKDDFIENLAIDDVYGKLYVVGTTSSPGNLNCTPTYPKFTICNTSGYSQLLINGSGSSATTDGFLLRFTLGGVLEWSTFIGGSGEDGATGVATNSAGDVYVAGYTKTGAYGPNCTTSSTGFPLCNNGYTQTAYAGVMDNFITKFDRVQGLRWSTYIGGGDGEGLEDIVSAPKLSVDDYDDVYIYGNTRSGSNTGGLLSTFNQTVFYNASTHMDAGMGASNTETYIMGFDKNNNRFYSSYFGGKGFKSGTIPRYGEYCGGIVATSNGRLYICGGTYSTSLFPLNYPATTSPYYQGATTVNSTYRDGFIADIKVPGFVSTSEITNFDTEFNVYPNPSNGQYNLEFYSNLKYDITIEVFNLLGEKVYAKETDAITGKNQYRLDLSKQADGIYLVTVKTPLKLISTKIIKN